MYNKINRIHLVGAGGIGMSGIAELLLSNGYQVSGSDLKSGEITRRLETLGMSAFVGHRESNVVGAQLVVRSSAIRDDNPEMVAARASGIPVIPRAEMLAELMRLKYGIAVAGAHGKTTTTSLVAMALMEGGLDPTIVVGGRMDNFGGTNTRLGLGDFMVVEADESDGSFNLLSPSIGVVTNMDREHLDHYGSVEALNQAFVDFLNKIPFYGLGVVCGDDPVIRQFIPKVRRRLCTYGFGENNDYRILDYQTLNGECHCALQVGENRETLRLRLPGRHNALNALAALAVADEIGVDRQKSLAALYGFRGVQRRFHRRGERDGVVFIDDYAHHPTEIAATLSATREHFPDSRIRVIFQPHRYSRVKDLFAEFSGCFDHCDSVAVTDIYAAGEAPIQGISSETLAAGIAEHGNKNVRHSVVPLEGVEKWLEVSEPGDIILTLGAGDLPNVYQDLF